MALTILYVEDHKIVADAVKETLELEGWSVDVYADGLSALRQIESDTPYDLLLIDNDLPAMSGVEVIRKTRLLPHRKNLAIIMLSSARLKNDALKAGADLFLRKPEGIKHLTDSVAELLARL